MHGEETQDGRGGVRDDGGILYGWGFGEWMTQRRKTCQPFIACQHPWFLRFAKEAYICSTVAKNDISECRWVAHTAREREDIQGIGRVEGHPGQRSSNNGCPILPASPSTVSFFGGDLSALPAYFSAELFKAVFLLTAWVSNKSLERCLLYTVAHWDDALYEGTWLFPSNSKDSVGLANTSGREPLVDCPMLLLSEVPLHRVSKVWAGAAAKAFCSSTL